jgi:hypothetical protein
MKAPTPHHYLCAYAYGGLHDFEDPPHCARCEEMAGEAAAEKQAEADAADRQRRADLHECQEDGDDGMPERGR